jgi:hypothetical protein
MLKIVANIKLPAHSDNAQGPRLPCQRQIRLKLSSSTRLLTQPATEIGSLTIKSWQIEELASVAAHGRVCRMLGFLTRCHRATFLTYKLQFVGRVTGNGPIF